MVNNRIVIGIGKEKDKKETEPILKNIAAGTQTITPNTDQKTIQEPLYENVWGNDYRILNMLDEKQLADRRLYARVIYMQNVECNSVSDNLESEPTLLSKPISFMVIDISKGGIGIICEHEVDVGTILAFKLTMDNIPYDIKCEVVYCFQNDDKFRAGLKIVSKDKQFMQHLKILVARLTLQNNYGIKSDNVN